MIKRGAAAVTLRQAAQKAKNGNGLSADAAE